ncbi:hypothetical protein BZA77DRAFT_103068 [Pyronema omphalodes]|nr:hypothetical protein BZA77DRAFT_103068 [Pyronema omphalodes]
MTLSFFNYIVFSNLAFVHTLCGVVGITPDCNICCHPLVTGSTPVGGTFFFSFFFLHTNILLQLIATPQSVFFFFFLLLKKNTLFSSLILIYIHPQPLFSNPLIPPTHMPLMNPYHIP